MSAKNSNAVRRLFGRVRDVVIAALAGTKRAGSTLRRVGRRVPPSLRPLIFSTLLTLLLVSLKYLGDDIVPSPTYEMKDLYDAEPTIRVRIAQVRSGESLDLRDDRPVVLIDATGARLETTQAIRFDGQRLTVGTKRLRLPTEVRTKDGGPIALGQRQYAGFLVVFADEGSAQVVNRVPIETYLEGVVLAEMGAGAPIEAIKAQAVASRAYALHRSRSRASRAFDVTDDQYSQVYVGIPDRLDRARDAVLGTAGLVLFHDGKLLEALYSSTCGGSTRAGNEAFDGTTSPLVGVPCTDCSESPTYRWSASVEQRALARGLGFAGRIEQVLAASPLPSGWLSNITFETDRGEKTYSLSKLKRAVGPAMRSGWVTRVGIRGGHLVVEGRGFGHGVGLCQYGARGRAKNGETFDTILAHYFPMARLARAYPLPPRS